METKHTAGPWVINGRSLTTVETQYGRTIASTATYFNNNDGGVHYQENEYNARLIAAVPEMLDMLGEAILQLQYLEERFPTGTTPNVISRIETLIQKATKP